ncbi:hypothetical protein [Tianweitania sediminis]|uniref:Uncharacterized protein n=1 Tax=Tianweitania sediminis TaxID=1502156 RepID=A0A8J7RJI0_9HYPH|nr:hypothetical protein [Tianweitania sediminis]MBP0438411.1 hypothetical protein [Tianweitania sediminis]
MTEPTQAAGADAPQPVILDAVASHYKRRVAFLENEALMMAITVRELDQELRKVRARNAELEMRARDHG